VRGLALAFDYCTLVPFSVGRHRKRRQATALQSGHRFCVQTLERANSCTIDRISTPRETESHPPILLPRGIEGNLPTTLRAVRPTQNVDAEHRHPRSYYSPKTVLDRSTVSR
ncbi:MAG: hypothetical protein ABIH23_02370, partial [bacterium]